MKCPGCGREIDSGSYVCPYCGIRKECLACASHLVLSWPFCHFCGSYFIVLNPDRKRIRYQKTEAFDEDDFDGEWDEDDFDREWDEDEWLEAEMKKYCGNSFAVNDSDGRIICLKPHLQRKILERILELTGTTERELAEYLLSRDRLDKERYGELMDSLKISEDERIEDLDAQTIRQRMEERAQDLLKQILEGFSGGRSDEECDVDDAEDEEEDERFEEIAGYEYETLKTAVGFFEEGKCFASVEPGFLASDNGWEVQELLEDLGFELEERTVESPYDHTDYDILFIR